MITRKITNNGLRLEIEATEARLVEVWVGGKTEILKTLPVNARGEVLEVYGKTATLYRGAGADLFGDAEHLTALFNA